MIVPIVFSLLMIRDKAPHLWFFYKCMHMFSDCNFPFVVMEEYLIPPSEFEKSGRGDAIDKISQPVFKYSVPTDQDIENAETYVIPDKLLSDIILEKGSRNNAAVSLFRDRNQLLEECLENIVLKIIESGREISAFLVLAPYPFVEYVAGKYGIKVINTEQGALREPMYIPTAYYDTSSIYTHTGQDIRYKNFCEEIKESGFNLLTSDEILSIAVSKPYLGYIAKSKQKPEYKLGIALGTVVPLYQAKTLMDDQEILWTAAKKYKSEELLVRKHPGDLSGAQYLVYDYCRDTSPNTIDFVLKCETVVSLGSNVSFEAMLFGRNGIVFVECPSSYMAHKSFDEKMTGLCEEEYLNFFVFCYLVPYDLFWTNDYLQWRLTNPPETEIYRKHLEYYLNAKGINESFHELPLPGRMKFLMDEQGFKQSEWKPPVPKRTKFTPREYQREIDRLKQLLSDKESEIEKLKESKL